MRLHKIKIILILAGIVLICLGAFIAIKARTVAADLNSAIKVKNELLFAVNSRDNNLIKTAIASARESTAKLKRDLAEIKFLGVIPGIENEMSAADYLLIQADYLIDSAGMVMSIADDAGISFAANTLSVDNPEILKKIDAAILANKYQIKTLADRGEKILNSKIPTSNFSQIQIQQETVGGYVKTTHQIERLFVTSEDGAAALLGLRGEKKYLLLFENSDELRPGGGIISTYGLITLKDGQPTNLFVDHVMNLGRLYSIPQEVNPEPIQQTMRYQKNLYIYDANWLVDPSVWLDKIFRSWNAQKPPVDGVIVMSTKMLEDAVRQYEPIKLPGTNESFVSKDIVASLDYYFDVEHRSSDFGKYKVLAPLVDELIKKIRTSNPDQLQVLLGNVKKRFQSRDIFVYTKDQSIVDALKNNGIQSDLETVAGDEFYALGANLGSGKADGRMQRSLAMRVFVQEEMPTATATITQDYTLGRDDFRAGGYYGYVRFVLPLTTRLGEFSGFNLVKDEISTESGRQVFGNYFGVATGTKKNVSISYGLAENVIQQIKDGSYSLTLRKQGGVEMPYEVKLNIPDTWKKPIITTSDGTFEFTKNQSMVTWEGVLTKDVQIEIKK